MILFLLIESLIFCLFINSFFIKKYITKKYKTCKKIIRTDNKKHKITYFIFKSKSNLKVI